MRSRRWKSALRWRRRNAKRWTNDVIRIIKIIIIYIKITKQVEEVVPDCNIFEREQCQTIEKEQCQQVDITNTTIITIIIIFTIILNSTKEILHRLRRKSARMLQVNPAQL